MLKSLANFSSNLTLLFSGEIILSIIIIEWDWFLKQVTQENFYKNKYLFFIILKNTKIYTSLLFSEQLNISIIFQRILELWVKRTN
jgi:hypothetical protein